MMSETLFSKPIESTFNKSSDAASKYKFERILKRTLCGTIRLATNIPRKSLVAIKLSSRKQLGELNLNNCAENPLEEVRLMTKLRDSPFAGREYVIQLLDTYTMQKGTDIIDCTVLEFADGGEFFEHIQNLGEQGGRMELDSVRAAFSMIAKGVRFIHKNGIVHLDLSLENILLTKQNVLKICDFGLAREGRIFKLSTVPGKFPYMAPEVFARKEFDGQKADVWSLGVILWCLLTSLALYEIPADSDARFQRLRSGKHGIKEIITAFKVQGIPEVVIDLLSGMLSVDPTQRFNIQQVLDHPWLNPPMESESTSVHTKPSSSASLSSTREKLSMETTTLDSGERKTFAPHPTSTTIIIDESPVVAPPCKYPPGFEKKLISPPTDETWSTYHRLYEQFEEKYGKLLAQQEYTSKGSRCYDPIGVSPYNSGVAPPKPKSEDPTPASARRSSGWKRKMGFEESERRRLSPSRFALEEASFS